MIRERQVLVITQTITRSSTTLTTQITFGRAATAPPDSTTTLTPGAPVPTPTVMAGGADGSDDGLSSGEIGAILACVVFLVTGVLVALHITLSRRRRARTHHQVWTSAGSTSGESSEWSARNGRMGPRGPSGPRWSTGWREVEQRNGRRISVREREEIGVRERGRGWVDGASRAAARGRRVPDVREIRVQPRVVPVFSPVTHVRMPPPSRVRRPVRSISSDSGD